MIVHQNIFSLFPLPAAGYRSLEGTPNHLPPKKNKKVKETHLVISY